MTKTQTINANHPDYWAKLREAHSDISDLIIAEWQAANALPEGEYEYDPDDGSVWSDNQIHEEYDRMQDKAEANPLLARLLYSLSIGEINNLRF